jgi:hypothetical protein
VLAPPQWSREDPLVFYMNMCNLWLQHSLLSVLCLSCPYCVAYSWLVVCLRVRCVSIPDRDPVRATCGLMMRLCVLCICVAFAIMRVQL